MVKYAGLTSGMPLILQGLSYVKAVGIPGVGVKSVDIRRNTDGEGKLLDDN